MSFFSRPLHGMRWRWVTALHILTLSSAAEVRPLRAFSEVRALSQEEAAKGRPVRVEAIVLGSDPASPWSLFLHDGTAGCYVKLLPGEGTADFLPGSQLQVEGTSMALGYYPSVGRARAHLVGAGALPVPRRLSAEEIFAPEFDSAWVEVPAVVVGFEVRNLRLTLDVEVYGLPFKAELPLEHGAEARASGLLQRPVSMRGVLGTIFNRQRQMTDRHFFVASLAAITPIRVPAAGAAPRIAVAQLLTGAFGPQTHVSIEGVVTQANEKGFYLRDATGSALVNAAPGSRFPPGARVEVEGFGSVAPFRPVMRAAKVVELGRVAPPRPVSFDYARADLPAMHAELVTVDAEFLARQDTRGGHVLECVTGRQIFEVRWPAGESAGPALAAGDRLRLVGICELTTTHALPRIGWVDGFRLHLAGPAGLTVLTRGPWWTARRLLVALGVMSAVAALGLTGTWIFRRRVQRQMEIIGDSVRVEAVAKERDRIARELHDSLEQQLSGVALQLDGLDDTVRRDPPAAARALQIARRMLRYTRLEARRSVWDLRSKILETHGLVAALQEMASSSEAPHGPKIEVRTSGAAQPFPAATEFHLFRIAQEALANAIKHGEARHVVIGLEHLSGASRLTVRDDGRGFEPEEKQFSPGPHFGLLGMRERAAKIGGDLRVDSGPGRGCEIAVTVGAPAVSPAFVA